MTHPPSFLNNRWVQLTAGVCAMVAVANFQYAWTLFVLPLIERHNWSKVAVQDALYLYFIPAQTLLVPIEGYLAERFGPRRLLVGGGILAALAWLLNAATSSLAGLYLAQVLSGIGSGIVYSLSMGSALKWFPDRRGLAAGLTAAAFGAGSAATVLPIGWTIRHAGYETAFVWFGLGQGLIVVLAGLVMRFPQLAEVKALPSAQTLSSGHDRTPRQMLAAPGFWLLYLMMTVGAVPGLLMLGELKPMAVEFGIADVPFTWLGVTVVAADLAIMLDRIMGGFTRPLFGWLSDHIGREAAMFLAFGFEGIALFVLIQYADNAAMFVVMSGIAFFGWGAVFSLFPAVSGDMFGRKHAATNYALLYTAKGAATLLVAGCGRIHEHAGNWNAVFAIMIAADLLAALLAVVVLRPLRRRVTALKALTSFLVSVFI